VKGQSLYDPLWDKDKDFAWIYNQVFGHYGQVLPSTKRKQKQSAHQEQPRTRRTDLKFIYKTVVRVYNTLFGDHMLCYKHQIFFYVQITPCRDMGFNEIHNYDTLGNDV